MPARRIGSTRVLVDGYYFEVRWIQAPAVVAEVVEVLREVRPHDRELSIHEVVVGPAMPDDLHTAP